MNRYLLTYTFISATWSRINKLHAIPSKKISVSSWRYHSFVFNLNIRNVNETRLELFEVKMDINIVLAIFTRFRDNKFKKLFIPALAHPTDITEFRRFHASRFSSKNNIIAIDIFMHD